MKGDNLSVVGSEECKFVSLKELNSKSLYHTDEVRFMKSSLPIWLTSIPPKAIS